MLDRLAINDGRLEHLRNASVNGVTLFASSISNPGFLIWILEMRLRRGRPKGRPPHETVLTYKIFNSAARRSEHDRLRVIRLLALGLRVHADKVELVPHGLHQLINVPSVLRADRDSVRNSIEKVKLLNADRINLVQTVDNGDITGE
jgi:hypothetical protein